MIAVLAHLLPQRTRDACRDFLYRRLNLRQELRSGLSLPIQDPSDWHLFNEIFIQSEYDAAIATLLDTIRNGSQKLRVLDLGANVGFFAMRVVDLLKSDQRWTNAVELILVEGSPRNAARLRALIASQSRELNLNARIIHGLAGRRAGTGQMVEHGLHMINRVSEDGTSGTAVGYVDLDEIVGAGPLDLIKCDIEGSELAFIENYPELLRRTASLVIELHPTLCDTKRCVQLLTEAGFDRHQVLASHTETSTDLFTRSKPATSGAA